MAKSPCLDCIDKYEKSKQRKRNAKKRQKKKEELMKPTPSYRNVIPRGSERFIPPTTPLPQTNNLADLLAVLRVNEALKQQATQPTLDTLERQPKSKPKTANEAVSQSIDYFLGNAGDTAEVSKGVLRQTPSALTAPITTATNFAGDIVKPLFQFLESKLPKPVQPSLERTPPASAPPLSVLTDLQNRTLFESARRDRYLPRPDEETGSRFIEEQRRLSQRPYFPAPPRFQPPEPTPVILVGQPPDLIGGQFSVETETADALGGEQTAIDLMLRPRVDAPLVPVSRELIPETESLISPEEEASFEDATGNYGEEELPLEEAPPAIETAQSLETGVGFPDIPFTAQSLAEEQPAISPRSLNRQTTEELALSVEDIDVNDLSAIAKQKAYDDQKREDAKTRKLEENLAKILDKEERDKKRAEIAAEKIRKAEEKRLKKEEAELAKRVEKRSSTQLNIAGLKRSDVANTPNLFAYFNPKPEELQYGRLLGASKAVPASQLQASEAEAEEEPPQEITFTKPSEPTFKFAEGGGI